MHTVQCAPDICISYHEIRIFVFKIAHDIFARRAVRGQAEGTFYHEFLQPVSILHVLFPILELIDEIILS